MSALLDKLRRTPRRLYFPAGDLGLDQDSVQGLSIPDDIPIVLAIQTVQTPTGPHIVQFRNGGGSGRSITTQQSVRVLTTEVAGNTGQIIYPGMSGCTVFVEVLALTGSPTNIMYRAAISIDNGTTWYEGASITSTTTGLIVVQLGQAPGNPGTGNDIKAVGGISGPPEALYRIDWLFTGGTAPTVQHRMTGYFN